MGRRACPVCAGPLERVSRPSGSALNADQFDAVKAGDWWCVVEHPGQGNGLRSVAGGTYFWDHDLEGAERAKGWEDYPERTT